ncbi:MAG: glycosyltransferase family 2 protein [Candidatus Norongarragalinales archaeon]
MKISIVIPAYNEEKRILQTLEGLIGFLKQAKWDFEVLIVFDGTDSTPSVAKKFARANSLDAAGKIKLLVFKRRLGKGGALNEGLAHAKADMVFFMDADYSVPAKEMPKLLKALEKSDIAIASRYMPSSKTEIPAGRLLAAKAFNMLERLLFGLPYADTQCGFKAFRKSALEKLLPRIRTSNFVWDVDMLFQAKKLGLRVEEIPVEWHMREGGTITYANGLKTALKMFATLLKLRASN